MRGLLKAAVCVHPDHKDYARTSAMKKALNGDCYDLPEPAKLFDFLDHRAAKASTFAGFPANGWCGSGNTTKRFLNSSPVRPTRSKPEDFGEGRNDNDALSLTQRLTRPLQEETEKFQKYSSTKVDRRSLDDHSAIDSRVHIP